ncbi:MAG: tRNA pseudouridine(55) synthase TruB, partial [Deltaproteobacteria bacterium]
MTATAHGLLLVDKPAGVTSHDVVAWARRVFGQREAGHAGTLDPMATGLLVVLLGEATKLSAYLTGDGKAYLATVSFGASTDTLDADGVVTQTTDAPLPSRAALERALAGMVGPIEQVPPAVSAIKLAGVAMHERVRRGESPTLEPRSVVLEAARVITAEGASCEIDLECSKGFYVRALARDLAALLGTLGHLTALRRTRSGPFTVDEAFPGARLRAGAREGDGAAREAAHAALLPVGRASRSMKVLTVNEADSLALSQGKRLASTEPDGVSLVVREETPDRPVCIGEARDGVLRSARGFALRKPGWTAARKRSCWWRMRRTCGGSPPKACGGW